MNKPKIVVLGDLHFGNKGHSIDTFERQMLFIENQVFPYILDNKIKYVYQLGDTFHDRNKVDWYILNELKKRFFNWFDQNGVELHTLLGNHDTYLKSSLEQNAMEETTKIFRNVFVYSEPTRILHTPYTVGFNPWILDHKNPNLTDKVDILLGHFDVKGFPMMKNIYSKEGIDTKDFEKYQLVLSGHYHIRHIQDNFHMIGTPFQLTWNDWNQPRGFVVLDDQFNVEYMQNKINPQFVKLFYDNGEISVLGLDYDDVPLKITKEYSLEIVKNNYCRLFTKQIDDQMKLEAYHVSLLAHSCDNYKIDIMNLNDVVENFDATEFDEKFEDGEGTLELITTCIEGMTFDQGIDKDLLLELSRQSYKEAYDEVLTIGDNE